MQEVFRIDLNGVNSYLGKQDGNYILFDTGGHMVLDKQFDNRYGALKTQLKAHGCTPDNLKLIVLTHGDNDHAANASALRREFGAKIAMHENDRALVENPNIDMLMKTFNFQSVMLKLVLLIMKNQIRKITVKTLDEYERFKPDIFLKDGENLNKYGFDAKIYHLPGHTNGSIAILTSNNELIAGDIFMGNKKPEIAMLAYDYNILKDSIKKIKTLGVKTVLPGHGNPFKMNQFK